MSTNGICGPVSSISLINTLVLHLDWYSIDIQYLVDTIDQQLAKGSPTRIALIVPRCQQSVDRVSTEVSMECLIEGQSRVSIKGIDQHSTAHSFSTHDLLIQ